MKLLAKPVQRIHQPGNGTRYDLWFSEVAEGKIMVSWAYRGGSGGTFMIVNSPVHPSYVEEKMNICNADAEPISLIINNQLDNLLKQGFFE